MSPISAASICRSRSKRLALSACSVIALALLASSALAIDGNYASPYASQWDSRSAGLSIPGVTWLGILFLLVNGLSAFGYALRHRFRFRKAGPK